MIGTATALEHMPEGAPLTAEQALELGLVNAIVPDEELPAHAQATATRLARRSSVAVRAIKRLTYFTADLAELHDSPLSTGNEAWLHGTRVNQTGEN